LFFTSVEETPCSRIETTQNNLDGKIQLRSHSKWFFARC